VLQVSDIPLFLGAVKCWDNRAIGHTAILLSVLGYGMLVFVYISNFYMNIYAPSPKEIFLMFCFMRHWDKTVTASLRFTLHCVIFWLPSLFSQTN